MSGPNGTFEPRPNMLVVLLCCMMKMLEFSGPGRRPASDSRPRRRRPRRQFDRNRRGNVMNEVECVIGGGGRGDLNSNHAGLASANTTSSSVDRNTASCVSNASSQDIGDFVQDNSDYQWFLDYGYRDGGVNLHASILSSQTESYGGPDEIGYYDALSKNLDANLAEADMESFRTEDIHALLTTLPTMCTDMQLVTDVNREGEMFASVSNSMMAKFDFDSSGPHSSSQGEESAGSPSTMSICKSELLFSPVKETPMPGTNFSVDSLDCDIQDIMLTCQANKDNYTIAFEGSITMYSEESEDFHDNDKSEATSETHRCPCTNKHHQKILDTSMARSDSGLTTWSKLKKRSSENQLRRHPSGNNNNNNNSSGDETSSFGNMGNDNALKSQSMPNLHKQKIRCHKQKDVSSNCCGGNMSISSMESPSPFQQRMNYAKVFDIQHQTRNSSCYSDMAISVDAATNTSKPQAHNFSLVRLFMKQKSISAEGMSCGMDQSSASECWPPSEDSGDSFDLKSKSMSRSNVKTRSAPESSMFLDSLVVPGEPDSGVMHRTHELIREEIEDISERSESVEQLSESASRADSIFNSYHCCHVKANRFNVNNNNSSVEHDELCDGHLNTKRRVRRSTQTTRTSSESADASSSTESTECTKIHSNTKPGTTIYVSTKHSATQYPVHLINKSMQTSRLARSTYTNDYIRVLEPSFLTKLKQQGECQQKPIYVVYPNYTLPDLEFLKEKREDVAKVFLIPQKYTSTEEETQSNKQSKKTPHIGRGRRPFSCNDMEMLKKKGFSHIRDWDSLTFLLPVECRQVLADVPEYQNVVKDKDELLKPKEKPLFCVSPPMRQRQRPVSCDCGSLMDRNNVSSSSSTATQPSSGYRGSSTMLMTDSSQNSPATVNNFNPLFVYRYDSVTSSEASLLMSEKQRSITTPPVPKRSISLSDPKGNTIPPRPPLPKGILRKNFDNCNKAKKNMANTKRYSMFEMGETDEFSEEDTHLCNQTHHQKRKSLHEPYYLPQRRTFSEQSTETEDEGVEAGHGTDSSLDERFESIKVRPPTPPLPKTGDFLANFGAISVDELEQLEEYLKMSGVSYSENEEWDETDILQLRSHVGKFLNLKINKDQFDSNFAGKKTVSFAERAIALEEAAQKLYSTPPNSPNVSAMLSRHFQGKALVDMPICEEGELSPEGFHSPQMETIPLSEKNSPSDTFQKMGLITAVTQSVEQLIQHFSAANDQGELNALGDYELNPACAKLVLSSLCPSLYSLLSDGLKPTLDTPFGSINNSVWQVVEASAQQGPLTKALNELVMKINSEDVISEGLLKFNAFVLGLLNVRSLDAWASYLRTRETILRKHYNTNSLLLQAQTGGASMRSLLDTLVATLQPLALLPFQIDLLFEYRQLHNSLKRMGSYHQPLLSPTHHMKVSPMSHLSNKQLTLMKLVRSVQSSMSQSYDDTEELSVATMVRKGSPTEIDNSSDPSLPDLLNSSAHTKTQVKDERLRPRSCVDPNFKLVDDAAGTLKKRWSGIHLGSKFVQAFDRLADDTEEEYTDSLEHTASNMHLRQQHRSRGVDEEGSTSPVPSLLEDGPESLDSNLSTDDKPLNGGKFRRLQMKWEMLSGRESQSPPTSPSHSQKSLSKIPRLVTSPVKSGIPVLSPSFMKAPSKIPAAKKVTTPPGVVKKTTGLIAKPPTPKGSIPKKPTGVVTRTSRVDQLECTENRVHPVRPSSLPYRPVSSAQGMKGSKLTPPRRAVSSSVSRRPQQQQQNKTPKAVRTLTHRLPSDNGHLSFNEGDKLKVILEVDSKWLLCCRGDQKGLVPRSAVIAL